MTATAKSTVYRFDDIESKLVGAPKGRQAVFASRTYQKALTARLDDMLDGDKILSLDIFDTLLFRDNSSELTRFFEIGAEMARLASDKIGKPVAQVDAFMARYLGTRASYRASAKKGGCREGSLTEIHTVASRLLTGESALANDFIEAELSYEATRLAQNDFLVKYAAKHRKSGGRAVLLTDMYMHAEQVIDLLAKVGLDIDEFDGILSSADTKVSKASGGIFRLMEKKLDADPEEFVHLGDSFRGDVSKPRLAGWASLHLPMAEFDIVERRRDHLETAQRLKDDFNLDTDIAIPK